MRAGNMMRLIPITGWSPASSNADGMNAWRPLRDSKSRSRACRANSRARCATRSARRLLALADDLPRLWNHPAASSETRKRILRAVLNEIIVTVEADRLRLVLHWEGGDHTRLEVAKNRTGQNRWKTDAETVQLVHELARILPDHSIAPVLNRLGIRSAKGNSWTQLRVRNFRSVHQIAVYR